MVLALVASCTTTTSGNALAPDIEQRGPTGPVPGGLDRFYGQSLSWGDCEPYAATDSDREVLGSDDVQCTRLTVPLDYTKPDGDTITLGVSRRPAGDKARRIGSLVINPGGPGAAGLATAARLGGGAEDSELGQRFDFVGFDPRGVGSSEPTVRCLTDAERDAERADDDELDASPAGVAKLEADQKDYATKCAERTGKGAAMLANIGTRDVAKDMDVLRSALGDEKLTYLGYSYGTRIGSTYAETFPNNVRAMVLDGALDPNQDPIEELVAQGAGFQKAFDDFVAWCVQRQDCALGQDPAKALTEFLGLVRPLGERPVDVGDGRKLSYSDAMTGVIQALYADELWEYLNTGLTELKGNKAQTLMLLADTYLERGSDGRYSTTQDAFTAIRCVDDPRVTDKNVVLEAQRRYKAAAPFLDDGNPPTSALDACAFWPVPNTSQPHLPQIAGLPPVLVVSTTKDPATPYEAGVNLAKVLGGGLLTFEGTQHTAFLQSNRCVDDAGTRYLVDLRLPETGTRCS
ncbi:MAG TPA: alpha/beta hydrolase [Actinophytocola sp.]|uniref:alpha/beta hydrolase n=1 Tax=Actinophytocola sp. TaxID=1872138 RepID=UPI002DBBEBB2|nr:alpha/beta hydrolase [Actinophytocola sp.]HEU5469514.1 alpha/beta hydrolase [Actinophytocola sp.]